MWPFRESFSTKWSNHLERRLMNGSRSCAWLQHTANSTIRMKWYVTWLHWTMWIKRCKKGYSKPMTSIRQNRWRSPKFTRRISSRWRWYQTMMYTMLVAEESESQQHDKGTQRPLWEGRTERDRRPGWVPTTPNAAIAVESTLYKLALLKIRLATIAPTQSAAVRQRKRRQRVHATNDADYDTSDQESTIGCLSASVNTVHSGGQPYTTLHVGCDSVPMKVKVDTGAQINVIPITAFDTLAESRMKQLKSTQDRLTGYSGNVEPTTGRCRIECKLREKPHTLEVFFLSLTHTQRQS